MESDGNNYQTGFVKYGNTTKRTAEGWLELIAENGIYKEAVIPIWVNPNAASDSRLVIEENAIIMYWVSFFFFGLCLYGIWLRIKELFLI